MSNPDASKSALNTGNQNNDNQKSEYNLILDKITELGVNFNNRFDQLTADINGLKNEIDSYRPASKL